MVIAWWLIVLCHTSACSSLCMPYPQKSLDHRMTISQFVGFDPQNYHISRKVFGVLFIYLYLSENLVSSKTASGETLQKPGQTGSHYPRWFDLCVAAGLWFHWKTLELRYRTDTWLVGGLEHAFYFPYIWDNPSHSRTHIFQDGSNMFKPPTRWGFRMSGKTWENLKG